MLKNRSEKKLRRLLPQFGRIQLTLEGLHHPAAAAAPGPAAETSFQRPAARSDLRRQLSGGSI